MRLSDKEKILVVAFGNVARGDDGLGIRFGEFLMNEHIDNVDVEMDYQLTIEMSADILNYEKVVFVDASVSCKEPFEFYRIEADRNFGFSSHSIRPEALLSLCEQCFDDSIPEAWVLAIRGYEFDLSEKLSDKASNNLAKALDFFTKIIISKRRCENGTKEKSCVNN